MKSKKAQSISIGFVLAMALAIVFAIVFIGGAGKIFDIVSFLYLITAWLYVVAIIIFIFMKWAS